jgi:hypothetical protein
MTNSNQIGSTENTGDQYPGYLNVTRDGENVTVTVRSGKHDDAPGQIGVRRLTRSEAISFFADALKVLA